MNGVHPKAPRAFQVQGTVINEKTLFRRELGDLQSHAKDQLLGIPGSDVTGAEENEKVPSKVEGLDAVLVELQRLVVDGADKIFPGAGDLIENGARLRKFLGLREHESGEFLACETARAIEQCPVEIFVQGDLSGVEGREREVVAILKFFPIQVKNICCFFSRSAVPTICQDDAADVPEQRGNLNQRHSTSGLWVYFPAKLVD